jgi:hypothetical protein
MLRRYSYQQGGVNTPFPTQHLARCELPVEGGESARRSEEERRHKPIALKQGRYEASVYPLSRERFSPRVIGLSG